MGLPVLLFVQNRQTNGSRRVDIGMWQYWLKDTLRRTNWVIVGEVHQESVATSFPGALFGAGDLAVPFEHVGGAVVGLEGLGYESERMIAPPLFPLFF